MTKDTFHKETFHKEIKLFSLGGHLMGRLTEGKMARLKRMARTKRYSI